MKEKRLTLAEYNQLMYKRDPLGNEDLNAQSDYLRTLRRSVNILYFAHIFTIPDRLGVKIINGQIADADGDAIYFNYAQFESLMAWLAKGIELLRNTTKRPPFDNGQTDMIIELYDAGFIYFA